MKAHGRLLQRYAVLFGIVFAVGSVHAQEAAVAEEESDRLLEEVIVTAEFRETSLQETPIAITAITGDMLEARGQTNLFEVAAQAPNVSLKPGGQARSGMMAYIRGVGQSDFIAALEPGVGIYVDDVYYAQLTGSLLELIDVDRIEVLRGPQGTLSGRNSIGGAIKLYSKRPGDGGESFRMGVGSFSEVNVRGTGDFTLVEDSLWLRFSGAAKNRDGYVDVLDYGCSHPGSGFPTSLAGNGCKIGEQGDKQYTTGRAALRWAASDDVEVNVIADVLNDRSGMAAGTVTYANRGPGEAITTLNPTLPFYDADGNELYYRDHMFVSYGPNRNPNDPINDPYVSYSTLIDYYDEHIIGVGNPAPTTPVGWKPSSLQPRNHINQWGVSANINWQINDNLNLTSITAYREYDTWSTWDEDGSPFAIVQLDNKLDNWQLTQELRLNGSFGENVDWTVGGYYLDQKSTYLARVDLNYAQIDFIHGPDPTPADTLAFFGHGSWDISERMRLSGGLRYSDEFKGYTHLRHNPDGSDIGSKGPTFPGAPDLINIRLTGVNGLYAEFDDSQTDWRVALDYMLNDEMMVYSSVSTGYKSGGVNPRPFFPIQLQTFNPETLTAYELGWKATLFDSLRLNAAVFLNEFEDIQLTLTQCEVPTFVNPAGFGPPCLKPANVGNADVKGLELEAHWYATENLLIEAMFSNLDFEYTFVDPFALQGSSIAPIDMITPHTPEEKWNIGAQYTFDFSDHGQLTTRVDAIYQSKTYGDATNKPVNQIDDYTLMNAIVWWDSADEDWRIDFTVLNLTDEVYYHDKYDLSGITSAGSVLAQPGMPRTYHLAFQRNFD